jgi:solute carrier family 35 (UDP-galactose transporter), member B1
VHTHRDIAWDITLFCVTSALGQKFVFMTMEAFSSLAMTTVTTTRKFFTIVLSVVWYKNQLSLWRWGAVGVVFVGVGMDAYESVRTKAKAHRG